MSFRDYNYIDYLLPGVVAEKFLTILPEKKWANNTCNELTNYIIANYGLKTYFLPKKFEIWFSLPENFHDIIIYIADIDNEENFSYSWIHSYDIAYENSKEIKIELANSACLISCKEDTIEEAIELFKEKYLNDFIIANFPEILEKFDIFQILEVSDKYNSDNTIEEKNKEISVNESDEQYKTNNKDGSLVAEENVSKHDKEFYEIDDGIFKVKYFDEEALIKDSTPLQYCYYVLCRPHRPISLTEIFCAVNNEDPDYIAPLIEGAVIDKNVNKTIVENLINDYNEKVVLLERAKLIILQEEDALNGIFHDGNVDLDATKPTSKIDNEKEKERIEKAKELSLRYLNSMDRLERELEAYEDIIKELNEQLKYQPKEVSNERNRYASRIRMGFSNFYKLLKAKKLFRLHDYLNNSIDVYSGYLYHPDDDFTTWKLTK